MTASAPAVGEWLKGSGPESDIVISSRLRLARNLAGFPFLTRASPREAGRIAALVAARVAAWPEEPKLDYVDLTAVEPLERQLLVERHLISREHAEAEGPRGVAYGRGDGESLMINEEDHLRLQVLRSGLQLRPAWERINELDDRLDGPLAYAFSERYGYLTACPSNAGTGLRVSVMLHLPALVMTRQIEKVFQAAGKLNFALRGLYGEGTQASGDFYQVSNQVTLGPTEEELLGSLESVVPTIIRYERRARSELLTRDRPLVEDKIFRAFGMLGLARMISSEEAMHWMSLVRMGINMKLIDQLSIARINELFILIQPAHLQRLRGRALDSRERNLARADFLRDCLNGRLPGRG